MNTLRTTRPQSLRFAPAVTLGLASVALATFAVIAFGSGPGGTDAGPAIPPPSPVQTEEPTPVATPLPTAEPTEGGADAMPIRVDLANATGADVYVDIVDHTGLLVDVASGTPGDGVSVEAYTVKVENLGPTTLRLSWMDYPIDNALALYVDRFEGGFRFVLVQPEPTGTTDAMGFDRELVLTFSEPISASQVETFLQGGLDTPG